MKTQHEALVTLPSEQRELDEKRRQIVQKQKKGQLESAIENLELLPEIRKAKKELIQALLKAVPVAVERGNIQGLIQAMVALEKLECKILGAPDDVNYNQLNEAEESGNPKKLKLRLAWLGDKGGVEVVQEP